MGMHILCTASHLFATWRGEAGRKRDRVRHEIFRFETVPFILILAGVPVQDPPRVCVADASFGRLEATASVSFYHVDAPCHGSVAVFAWHRHSAASFKLLGPVEHAEHVSPRKELWWIR